MLATDKLHTAADFNFQVPEGHTVPYWNVDGNIHRILPGGGGDKQVTAPLLQQIIQGADLNDYTSEGTYICPTNALCRTLSNTPFELISATLAPSARAFYMEVHRTTAHACMQTLVQYDSGDRSWQRRLSETGAWDRWYCNNLGVPTTIYVGPDREIKTLVDAASYIDKRPNAFIQIYLDPGTYTYSHVYFIAHNRLYISSVSGNAQDTIIQGNLQAQYCGFFKLENVTVNGCLTGYRGQYMLAQNCVITSSETNVCKLTSGVMSLNNCTLNNVGTGPHIVYMQQGAYLYMTACTLNGNDTNYALVGQSVGNVYLSGANTISNCKHVCYSGTGSHVQLDGTLALSDITDMQLTAAEGGYVKATATVTRSGTTSSVISSPALSTSGNQNSWVYYTSAYYST